MSVMLMKATCTNSGVPLQAHMVGMVVTETVVDIVVADAVVDGMVVVKVVVVVVL